MNVSSIPSSTRSAPLAAPESSAGPDAAARRKVAAQFEAILVRQLLGPSVGKMLGGDSVAGSVYGDMMTDALSQQMTAGGGLGLGHVIETQLTPRAERGQAQASTA